MFSKILLALAVSGALAGTAAASPIAQGEDLGFSDGTLDVRFYRSDRGSAYFGSATSTVATDDRPVTPAVPEPGSLLLVALAGAAVGATRRRLPAG